MTLNWTPDPPNGKDDQGNNYLSQCHVPYWDKKGEKKMLFVIWMDKKGSTYRLRGRESEIGIFLTIEKAKKYAEDFFNIMLGKENYNFNNPKQP